MRYNASMKKLAWIGIAAVLISILFASIYLVAQQTLRQNANDPQIQLAEDNAASFTRGSTPSIIGDANKTDIANSLAPFLMIYDNNRQLVVASAVLDGNTPVLPPGVLSNTSETRENRLTWQPRGGVRIAAVVVKYKNGYILAGRSLREVEIRENDALYMVMIGWLISMLFLIAAAWWLVDTSVLKPKHG